MAAASEGVSKQWWWAAARSGGLSRRCASTRLASRASPELRGLLEARSPRSIRSLYPLEDQSGEPVVFSRSQQVHGLSSLPALSSLVRRALRQFLRHQGVERHPRLGGLEREGAVETLIDADIKLPAVVFPARSLGHGLPMLAVALLHPLPGLTELGDGLLRRLRKGRDRGEFAQMGQPVAILIELQLDRKAIKI